MNNLREQMKGITLISLVITIIVILILTGVTVVIFLRENGIFLQAKTAIEEFEKASDIEKIKMSYLANITNKYISKDGKSLAEVINDEGYGEAFYNDETDITTVIINSSNKVYNVTPDGEITEVISPTSWYTEDTSTYYIFTADQLKGLGTLVSEGITFKDKNIILKANIDLKNKEWTPIGTSSKNFCGKFDGNNKTISNIYINLPNTDNVGLFGYATGGEIKNLTIKNANVTGKKGVGALAGTTSTSRVSNVTITGLVEITGYRRVAAVIGGGVYGTLTNLTVNVSDKSYVQGNATDNTNYVGGICGFVGEVPLSGGSSGRIHTNLHSNIDVIANNSYAGGIVGMTQYGNTFINCSSSGNVTILQASKEGFEYSLGGFAGVYGTYTDTETKKGTITFTDCTYTGLLSSKDINGNAVTTFVNNNLVGIPYNNVAGTNKVIINGVAIN